MDSTLPQRRRLGPIECGGGEVMESYRGICGDCALEEIGVEKDLCTTCGCCEDHCPCTEAAGAWNDDGGYANT